MKKQKLFPQIWNILNDVRGSLDNTKTRDVIFALLFYKFISDDFVNHIKKNDGQDYREIKLDEISEVLKRELINEKGYFIEPNDLFDIVSNELTNIENVSERLIDIFNKITNSANGTLSESKISHLFEDAKNVMNGFRGSISEKNKLFSAIMNGVVEMGFDNSDDNNIDIFGDVYEYLMHMYAATGGKSGGEFYTPQEVSELLAKLTLLNNPIPNSVYDPTCGSGSLLLKFKKVCKNPHLKYYGQEKDPTTHNLSRMNMFMHGVGFEYWDIVNGNTLTNPGHQDILMDAIVANPPYSVKWDGDSNIEHVNDNRFNVAGRLAPKNAADWAFILHSLSKLSENGSAAIVEFPGTLTRSGAEQSIRKYFIDNNKIDLIIQLPEKLFYGTGIATVILVLKNNKSDSKVKFINASIIYTKAPKQNYLSDENIDEILKLSKSNVDKEFFMRIVDKQEIIINDYDLGVKTYCPSEIINEEIDIEELNTFADKNMEEILAIMKKIKELRGE
ncbi:MAG: type I restriction-modification system subunit M [Mycoplasma sp.]